MLRWFGAHRRDLPWRRTHDPYKILVSEMMLQQTQVARVLEFYPRFLKRYPSIEKLAGARPSRVREAWDGLGYYNRAKYLHQTAKQVAKRHGGVFPRTTEELQCLPGIGRYTAGAIASFAYKKPAPILDTNVARVLRRVFGVRGDPKRSAARKRLWRLAERLIPTGKVWEFNQGLMDFGATVCTARAPRCPTCVMREICRYKTREVKSDPQ
ncbi:MAG: A/G-specific adenine glycosylase [Deltaproteobacteria bacterium]|nr:A/G-specific adenine glycosylase [Deltaproteobacteria bacterium]